MASFSSTIDASRRRDGGASRRRPERGCAPPTVLSMGAMAWRAHRWMTLVLIAMLAMGSSSALQLVAWGGMLLTRSVAGDFSAAVHSTFDGHHPCSLCRFIAHRQQDPLPAPRRVDLPQAATMALGDATDWCAPAAVPGAAVAWHAATVALDGVVLPPPVPPPRA